MYLEILKDHHASIYEYIHAINSCHSDLQVEQQADAIAKSLARLAGLISIHLAAEDKFLYPSLSQSSDDTVRQMAMRFEQDMGGLAAIFMAYKEAFMTPTKIKADIPKFRHETERVIGALLERLQREDKELYPLVAE